jgi:hypothetical protein
MLSGVAPKVAKPTPQHAPITALGALDGDVGWVCGVLVVFRFGRVGVLLYESSKRIFVRLSDRKRPDPQLLL